jgi:hypothetical protein
MFTSYLHNSGLPRGLRNNNPGNLVQTNITWKGKIPLAQNTDSRFEQFIELRYGIRALMRDVITDYSKGLNTVNSLISEFAPSFENNTTSYINTVSSMIGFPANAFIPSLTKQTLVSICKAIVYVENGASYSGYISNKDYEDAFKILGKSLPSSKKKELTTLLVVAGLSFGTYLLVRKKDGSNR